MLGGTKMTPELNYLSHKDIESETCEPMVQD